MQNNRTVKPKFKVGDVIHRRSPKAYELILGADAVIYTVFNSGTSLYLYSISITDEQFELANDQGEIDKLMHKYKIWQLTSIIEK